jgi:NAD(P)H dehydrogenase (quinone)
MIVVTGATGELGRAVVENLLRYVPAARVAVIVRNPEGARAIAARGVAVRRGDFDEPESLVRSFVGADRLLIVSASGIDHESRAVRHRNAINAAVRAGVGHVYYTSLLPGHDSVAHVMKAHLDTEACLKASGLPFTILKNGVYAESWQLYLGDVTGDEVVIPADGPVSWVSRADLAGGRPGFFTKGDTRARC